MIDFFSPIPTQSPKHTTVIAEHRAEGPVSSTLHQRALALPLWIVNQWVSGQGSDNLAHVVFRECAHGFAAEIPLGASGQSQPGDCRIIGGFDDSHCILPAHGQV